MKTRLFQLAVVFFVFLAFNAPATVLYVNVNGTSPTPPYTNWLTAAVVIQDAVDVASAGDQILVTNGVYQTGGRPVNGYALTNRVVVNKAVTIQSVNGPAVTIIKGYQVPGVTNGSSAVRCVYLTNNTTLIGFTLTNGATISNSNGGDRYHEWSGGAIWCESTSAIVSNCVLSGNSAYSYGGGAYNSTLKSCTLSGNQALSGGGGAYICTLNNCALTGNSSSQGGGAAFSTLTNCTLSGNSTPVPGQGGGVFLSTLNNCALTGNFALYGGGAAQGTLNNCRISSNTASNFGGGAYYATLTNCTLVGNSAYNVGGGAYSSTLYNCIIYYNTGGNYSGCGYFYCCTTPISFFWGSIGNFTNAPIFVNLEGGNLRLQSNSPCINSGYNAYAPTGSDLDGNPRIVGGTVDIGAYEYQTPTSVISYAWLQQYGLPTDGSADFIDSDGDGMNNYQEWMAGTDPTNPLSVLKMVSATPTNNPPGLVVTWQSVTNRTYYLQRSGDLSAQPAFSTIQSNIVGQANITDTNATGVGPFFYRVSIASAYSSAP
jgi:hypothetical protein